MQELLILIVYIGVVIQFIYGMVVFWMEIFGSVKWKTFRMTVAFNIYFR